MTDGSAYRWLLYTSGFCTLQNTARDALLGDDADVGLAGSLRPRQVEQHIVQVVPTWQAWVWCRHLIPSISASCLAL